MGIVFRDDSPRSTGFFFVCLFVFSSRCPYISENISEQTIYFQQVAVLASFLSDDLFNI